MKFSKVDCLIPRYLIEVSLYVSQFVLSLMNTPYFPATFPQPSRNLPAVNRSNSILENGMHL